MHKECLRALLPVASVAVRVAWMLQTDNYHFVATRLHWKARDSAAWSLATWVRTVLLHVTESSFQSGVFAWGQS